jgi:hypothetical protein
LAAATAAYTGFGTAFIDYDNDGWLDIVIANGAVHTIDTLVSARDPYPLHQKKQLFRNLRDGHFEETTAVAGPVFELSEVGRGLAVGDLDNDGGIDVVVSNNNGPLRVLINEVGGAQPWLGLRLLVGKRDAYGAKVEVRRNGAPTLWRRVRADGSYLAANDPRVLLASAAGAPSKASPYSGLTGVTNALRRRRYVNTRHWSKAGVSKTNRNEVGPTLAIDRPRVGVRAGIDAWRVRRGEARAPAGADTGYDDLRAGP